MTNWIYSLELAGTAVFAISGALAASRANMDIFGFSFVALMPAIGGGTLRDIVLGRVPVFWITDPIYVWIAIAAAVFVFVMANQPGYRRSILVWMDAIGLAVFAVIGTEISLRANSPPLIATMLGVVTAVTGGIVRDIICNEIPIVLTKEIYATAAFVASISYVLADAFSVEQNLALFGAILSGVATRGIGLYFGLSLPSFRK